MIRADANKKIITARKSVQYMVDKHMLRKKKTLQRKYLSEYPGLAAQWHPTKNGDLTPDQVTRGSNQKRWWLCGYGHEWEATVNSRVAGNGCPYCAGQKIIVGVNDLATKRPELITQWHPIKNGTLRPEDVTEFSHKNVWWLCKKGHEWRTKIQDRSRGEGCPYCAGKMVAKGENDLATQYPELVKEWNPIRNGQLMPTDVTPHSMRKVWWQCEKGHEWEANIDNRVKGKGCPYCKGRRAIPGETDLLTVMPELANTWHPTKNGALTPDQVTQGSNRKVWWQCDKGHEWQAIICDRANRNRGCPYCTRQKPIIGENDLATLKPELAEQWHPSRNHLKPTDVTCHSGKKVWWQCEKGHEWEAVIDSRSKGSGCPYCSGKRVLPGVNDIATIYPHLINSWDYDRNKCMGPEKFSANTHRKFWWKCSICNGSWYIAASTIRSNSNQLICPKCQGRSDRVITT